MERDKYIKETNAYVKSYELKVNDAVLAKYTYRGNDRYHKVQIAGILESPYSKKAIIVLTCEQYLHKEKIINTIPKVIVVNW